MKNLKSYIHLQDIDNFVYNLWQTDEFRTSHRTSGHYINRIINKFIKEPRFFAEMTDPSVEWSHFTAWMNLIFRREEFYKNPVISDLYYLHEIYHIISMQYDGDLNFEDWSMKMWDNERNASIQSEVEVYFALPTIRAKSFDFEIWVDRFLTNKIFLHPDINDNIKFYNNSRIEFQFRMQLIRSNAMLHPISGDVIEEVIADYAGMNVQWYYLWKSKYTEVETALSYFRHNCVTDKLRATLYLSNWYERQGEREICPFQNKARLFAEMLKITKEKKQNM